MATRKKGNIKNTLVDTGYYSYDFQTNPSYMGNLADFNADLSSAVRAMRSASETIKDIWLGAKRVTAGQAVDSNGQIVNTNQATQRIYARADSPVPLDLVQSRIRADNANKGDPQAHGELYARNGGQPVRMLRSQVEYDDATAKKIISNRDALLARGIQMERDEKNPNLFTFTAEAYQATYKSGEKKGQLKFDSKGNPVYTSDAVEFLSTPSKVQKTSDKLKQQKEEEKQKRKEEAERDKEEAERDKEAKASKAKTLSTLAIVVLVLRAIYNALKLLVTASLERATEEVQVGRTARNLGVNPTTLTRYSYLAEAKGLDKNVFTDALAGIQDKYGDITKGFKAPDSFIVTVRGDIAKLVQSGLANGENSDKIMRAVLDDYLNAYNRGVNALGQRETDDANRRRSLVTSLTEFSPELAKIFASMLDEIDFKGRTLKDFSEYEKSFDTERNGLTDIEYRKLEEMGNIVNGLKSVITMFKDKVFVRVATSLESILSFLLRRFTDKNDEYQQKFLAYENNVKALDEFQKRDDYYTSYLDEMLADTYNVKTGKKAGNLQEAMQGYTERDFENEILKSRNGYLIASWFGRKEAKQGIKAADKELRNPDSKKFVNYSDQDEAFKIKSDIDNAKISWMYTNARGEEEVHKSPLAFAYASDQFDATMQKLPSWYVPKDAYGSWQNLKSQDPELWSKMQDVKMNKMPKSSLTSDEQAIYDLLQGDASGKGYIASAEKRYLDYQAKKVSQAYEDMVAEEKKRNPNVDLSTGVKQNFVQANLFGTGYQDFAAILQTMAKNQEQLFGKTFKIEDGKLEISVKNGDTGKVIGTQSFPFRVYANQN